jgi:demethoxyubiquinone hydroxylase (CLK1/Coq7/Cat5 family)
MWDQERKHLASFGLGAVTAPTWKEVAMACIEVLETVIGEYYDGYVSLQISIG